MASRSRTNISDDFESDWRGSRRRGRAVPPAAQQQAEAQKQAVLKQNLTDAHTSGLTGRVVVPQVATERPASDALADGRVQGQIDEDR